MQSFQEKRSRTEKYHVANVGIRRSSVVVVNVLTALRDRVFGVSIFSTLQIRVRFFCFVHTIPVLYFRNNHGLCMLNLPDADVVESSSGSNKLAGEKFTADDQCRLVFGPESTACSYMVGSRIM